MKTQIFSQLRSIDTAFKHLKLFCICFLAACTIVTVCVAAYSFGQVTASANRVYVLAGGKVLQAMATDRRDNLTVELRDHLRNFHQNFFDLSPNESAIKERINKALLLADRSAERAYSNRREQNFYTNLVAGGIVQRLTIDSIAVDVSRQPYSFTVTAKEHLERSTSSLTKQLITRGSLHEVARTDDNPHGFLIRDLEIIENDLAPKP